MGISFQDYLLPHDKEKKKIKPNHQQIKKTKQKTRQTEKPHQSKQNLLGSGNHICTYAASGNKDCSLCGNHKLHYEVTFPLKSDLVRVQINY